MQVVLMLHQLAALDWLDQLGLRPDAYLGHSIGDYLVLHAAGSLPMESLVRLVVGRAICIERCIANQSPESTGGMLVIREPLEKSEKRLDDFSELTLANRNAPKQGVVAGPVKQLDALQNLLEKDGVDAVRLDLSVAYHHKCLQPAADEFSELLQQVVIQAPAGGRSVRLSTDPSRSLMDPEDIRSGLRNHLCGQVDFQASVTQTEAMWQVPVMWMLARVRPEAACCMPIRLILTVRCVWMIATILHHSRFRLPSSFCRLDSLLMRVP